MIAMYFPPTAKIQAWRLQEERDRDIVAIRTYAYDLAKILKEYCQIF